MDHDKKSKRGAYSEEDKELLFMVGLGVFEKQSLLVEEDRPSLLKRDAVFPLVGPCLSRIPLEPDLTHDSMYTYRMYTHNRLKILSSSIPESVGTFRLTFQGRRHGRQDVPVSHLFACVQPITLTGEGHRAERRAAPRPMFSEVTAGGETPQSRVPAPMPA